MQQLDIFNDSQDTMLRHALALALMQDDVAAAWLAHRELAAFDPQDRLLDMAAALIRWLQAPLSSAHSAADNAADITSAHAHLAGPLHAAALAVLGPADAQDWLARRWRERAQACQALAYTPAQPDSHAAACWLRVGDLPAAQQAVLAVERIESWRRKPQPLAWMAQARAASGGLDAAWPLLVELALLAPQRLPALLAALAAADEPLPTRLARRFENHFDEGPALGWRWWPAWLLVEQPLLAPVLAATEPSHASDEDGGERGFRVMLALLRHERLGEHRERTAARRVLQGLCPALFTVYMATR